MSIDDLNVALAYMAEAQREGTILHNHEAEHLADCPRCILLSKRTLEAYPCRTVRAITEALEANH